MKQVGIIAEYNPFHNGHAYQIRKVKELFPDKKVIVIMSGNYVQRGEPAVYNKYLRTQCALAGDVDIIFELPLWFATASAEHFASAAVLALHKLSTIDTLCFGAETDNLPLLQEIAHLLVAEPEAYKTFLQNELKKGHSFPKARMIAITSLIHHPETEQILQQPNNILAIEYLKAIERYHINITPFIIQRVGSGYHDTNKDSHFCSATAIRKGLQDNAIPMEHTIPADSFHIIQNDYFAKPLLAEDFYNHMQHALWREAEHFSEYLDVSESLANQIQSLRLYPQTLTPLIDTLSNRNYTSTRIRRVLFNILLDIRQKDMEYFQSQQYVSYLRLLGFRKHASNILKDIKSNSNLPIINKVANAKDILNPEDYSYFKKELQKNHLYTQIFFNKYGISIPSEYEHTVIISD